MQKKNHFKSFWKHSTEITVCPDEIMFARYRALVLLLPLPARWLISSDSLQGSQAITTKHCQFGIKDRKCVGDVQRIELAEFQIGITKSPIMISSYHSSWCHLRPKSQKGFYDRFLSQRNCLFVIQDILAYFKMLWARLIKIVWRR